MEPPAVRIGMREATTRLSRLGRLARGGREVVICRYGKPFLKLIPLREEPPPRKKEPRRLGFLRGQVRVAPDFDETPDEVIRSFEGA